MGPQPASVCAAELAILENDETHCTICSRRKHRNSRLLSARPRRNGDGAARASRNKSNLTGESLSLPGKERSVARRLRPLEPKLRDGLL
jgi:hypothetical protein